MAVVPELYRDAPRWAFGDSPALADELLALVLSGAKRATCDSLAAQCRESSQCRCDSLARRVGCRSFARLEFRARAVPRETVPFFLSEIALCY